MPYGRLTKMSNKPHSLNIVKTAIVCIVRADYFEALQNTGLVW